MRSLAFILAVLLGASPVGASDPARAILGDWYIDSMAAVEARLSAPISLRFVMKGGRGSVAGLGGCNAVRRGFEIKDGAIVLHGGLRATRRYCGRLPQQIQGVASRILGHETGWALVGGQLVLSNAGGGEVARFGRRIPGLSPGAQGTTTGSGVSRNQPSR